MNILRQAITRKYSIAAALLLALALLFTGSLAGCSSAKDLTLEEIIAEIIAQPEVKQFKVEEVRSFSSNSSDEGISSSSRTRMCLVDKTSEELRLKTESTMTRLSIFPDEEDMVESTSNISKETCVLDGWVYEYWHTSDTPGAHRDPYTWYQTALSESGHRDLQYYFDYYDGVFDLKNKNINTDVFTLLGSDEVNGVDCYKLSLDIGLALQSAPDDMMLPENQTCTSLIWIDKSSFRTVKYDMTTTTTDSEGEVIAESHTTTIFSQINDISITLPEEAKNAVRIY